MNSFLQKHFSSLISAFHEWAKFSKGVLTGCLDFLNGLLNALKKRHKWRSFKQVIVVVNQRIGLLNRIKHLLTMDALVALYNALIRPLFDFADTIWGDRDNITLINT